MTLIYMLFQICTIDLLQRNGLNNVHSVLKKKENIYICQGAFDIARSFPFLLVMNNMVCAIQKYSALFSLYTKCCYHGSRS